MRSSIVLALLCLGLVTAGRAQEASIRLLTGAEARSALTDADAQAYYAGLQLGEMRAKTGLALQNDSLAEARARVMNVYGERTLDFSPEEQAMLRAAIASLQPRLRERAPLYARTPWSLIKVAATVEGGLPHTRGDSIVLSDAVLTQLLRAHETNAFTQPSGLWNLLVHEQTHVLQRRDAARFDDLYTQVFGFRHVVLEPMPAWLRVRNVVNPDGPVQDWVFPDGEGAARRWWLPEIQLRGLEAPRMPEDFELIATPVQARGRVWEYLQKSAPAAPEPLANFTGFFAKFPIRDELFHPNEIAAGLLAALITGYGEEIPQAAIWDQTRRWSIEGLR